MSQAKDCMSASASKTASNSALSPSSGQRKPSTPRGAIPRREDVLDSAAEELRALATAAAMDLSMRVGEVIIRTLYGGSFKAWRRRGKKCNSLRTLACRPDVPMSATAIYRAVAIYELVCRVGGLDVFCSLSVSHYRAVLRLPSAKQTELLALAEAERWTAAELERHTRQVTPEETSRSRGGRPPLNPVRRAVRRAARVLEEDELRMDDLAQLVDGPDGEAARQEFKAFLSRVAVLAEALDVDLSRARRTDDTES